MDTSHQRFLLMIASHQTCLIPKSERLTTIASLFQITYIVGTLPWFLSASASLLPGKHTDISSETLAELPDRSSDLADLPDRSANLFIVALQIIC